MSPRKPDCICFLKSNAFACLSLTMCVSPVSAMKIQIKHQHFSSHSVARNLIIFLCNSSYEKKRRQENKSLLLKIYRCDIIMKMGLLNQGHRSKRVIYCQYNRHSSKNGAETAIPAMCVRTCVFVCGIDIQCDRYTWVHSE